MTSKSATPEPEVSDHDTGLDASNMTPQQANDEETRPEEQDTVTTPPQPVSGDKPPQKQEEEQEQEKPEPSSSGKPIDSDQPSKDSTVTLADDTNDSPVADTSNAPPLPDEPLPSQKTDQAEHPAAADTLSTPPLPNEPLPSQQTDQAEHPTAADTSSAPPLPKEPLPSEQTEKAEQDDGWDYTWDPTNQAFFFWNRFTNETTWENPRVPVQGTSSAATATVATTDNTRLQTPPATAVPPTNERLPAGGYNPAIHGDYDPNAWYAKNLEENDETEVSVMDTATAYAAIGTFNRFTGRWQGEDQNPERHSDEAKSRRQMNAFFDVDAAANSHDGRSLKAERSGKKPSKTELKQFKEKRRARKEEKRRAWLRD